MLQRSLIIGHLPVLGLLQCCKATALDVQYAALIELQLMFLLC